MNRTVAAHAVQLEIYRRSFERFAVEQLKIKGAAPGEILALNLDRKPVQRRIWNKVQEQLKGQGFVRGRILKGRQQGCSTITQGLMYWKASTTQNFDALLMAQDGPTTEKVFQIARHYYENVAPIYRPMSRYNSKKALVFENADPKTRYQTPGLRSSLDFQDATRAFAGTGQTKHGLHTTEAAKYPEDAIHILVGSLLPALHDLPGTFHLDESTAFVTGDWFHEGCDEARSGLSRYFWVFSPWYADPEYQLPLDAGEQFRLDAEERLIAKIAAKGQREDEVPPHEISLEQFKWRRGKIQEFERAGITSNGAALFHQEFPTSYDEAWISFDCYVFNRSKIWELEKRCAKPRLVTMLPGPQVVDALNDTFGEDDAYSAIFHYPEKGKVYDLGVDIAGGIEGGDWTVIQVLERYTRRHMAEIHLQCDAEEQVDAIYWWGHFYNKGQVGIEFNSVGIAVNQMLQRRQYPYLYFWRNRGGAYPKMTRLTAWKTTQESKKLMVTVARSRFNRDEAELSSHWLLHELAHFIQIPSGEDWRYVGQGAHDDRVMAWMIALMIGDDESWGREPSDAAKEAAKIRPGMVDVGLMDVDSDTIEQMKRRFASSMGIREERY